MFYAIWRNQSGKVAGFIVDEPDEMPTEFISEAEGHDKLMSHILYPFIEFIEL